jgi:predicted nucleic acid-binding protein
VRVVLDTNVLLADVVPNENSDLPPASLEIAESAEAKSAFLRVLGDL